MSERRVSTNPSSYDARRSKREINCLPFVFRKFSPVSGGGIKKITSRRRNKLRRRSTNNGVSLLHPPRNSDLSIVANQSLANCGTQEVGRTRFIIVWPICARGTVPRKKPNRTRPELSVHARTAVTSTAVTRFNRERESSTACNNKRFRI